MPLPVGGALDDELEYRALQAVDRRLCEQSIGHHGDHLIRGPVARDNRADLPVPFDDEFVEVGGLSGFKPVESEIIEHEEVHALKSSHLLVVAGVEANSFESFEQFVRAFGMYRVTAAHGDVP